MEKEEIKDEITKELIKELVRVAVEKMGDPWKNLTVKDVAKDLKLGENKANEVFKRKDFPSVNIGKTKTILSIAFCIWKLSRREDENKDEEREEKD